MPEICVVRDDGTEETVRLSKDTFKQIQMEALGRGIEVDVVIKEMADDLRKDKQML
jgi:hypothetical protein